MTWKCHVCAEEIEEGQPWVLFNRYAVGTGNAYCLSQCPPDAESGYCWDQDEGEHQASGLIVHFPGCLHTHIEAKMIQTDYEVR